MIIAPMNKCLQYAHCHPGLLRGFKFLQSASLADFPDGKHVIDDEKLFAIFAHDQGREREGAVLEFHRRYIDIQVAISGAEVIGWQRLEICQQVKQAYDPERDLGFYHDRPQSWFDLAQGSFAVFFPEDAHAPLAASGLVHKVVIKVAV